MMGIHHNDMAMKGAKGMKGGTRVVVLEIHSTRKSPPDDDNRRAEESWKH